METVGRLFGPLVCEEWESGQAGARKRARRGPAAINHHHHHHWWVGDRAGFGPRGSGGTDKLSTNPKSGDGIWFATSGTLLVADGCEMSGPPRWEIIEQDYTAVGKIQIDEDALGLTGDFDLRLGTLQVNDSIKTEGKLDFKKGYSGDFVEIRVAAGKTAEFGMNSSCP